MVPYCACSPGFGGSGCEFPIEGLLGNSARSFSGLKANEMQYFDFTVPRANSSVIAELTRSRGDPILVMKSNQEGLSVSLLHFDTWIKHKTCQFTYSALWHTETLPAIQNSSLFSYTFKNSSTRLTYDENISRKNNMSSIFKTNLLSRSWNSVLCLTWCMNQFYVGENFSADLKLDHESSS